MFIAAQFNPQTVTGITGFVGTFSAKIPNNQGPGTIVVRNKSYYDLLLIFADQTTDTVESGLARRFDLDLPSWIVQFQVLNNNSLVRNPSILNPFQVVVVETYLATDVITEQFPQELPILWIPELQRYVIGGQIFSASTGRINATVAGNFPLAIYNDNTTGKIVTVLTATCMAEASSNFFLMFQTANPAYGTLPNIVAHDGNLSNQKALLSTTTANQSPTPTLAQQMKATVKVNDTLELLNGIPFTIGGVSPGNTNLQGALIVWNSLNAITHWANNMTWLEM